jgi:hypothetical protein
MMYRRNSAQTPRPAEHSIAAPGMWDAVKAAVAAWLANTPLYDAAWRENRRRDRAEKRAKRHGVYFSAGLNGEAAMARRRRQIAAGSLKAENGLSR